MGHVRNTDMIQTVLLKPEEVRQSGLDTDQIHLVRYRHGCRYILLGSIKLLFGCKHHSSVHLGCKNISLASTGRGQGLVWQVPAEPDTGYEKFSLSREIAAPACVPQTSRPSIQVCFPNCMSDTVMLQRQFFRNGFPRKTCQPPLCPDYILARCACAAARRAIGTRNGEQET